MTRAQETAAMVPSGRAWVRGISLFISAGVALYLAGVVWSGWAEVLVSWRHLGLALIGLAMVAASTAYLLRFCRWQLCLLKLGHPVPAGRSLGVYLAGLALTTSPGKMGETVRSLLLLQDGVPAKHSVGAFLTDRLSDVIGVCLLGGLASVAAGGASSWLIAVAGGVAGGSLLFRQMLRSDRVNAWWQVLASRWPRVPWHWFHEVLVAWARLWSAPRVLAFTLLASVAYGIQAAVFVLLCRESGIGLGLAQGVYFFANATLFGAASMLPGGLGAMEAALVWQLGGIGVVQTQAVAIAIATRLVTLWCGIALGLMALLWVTRKPLVAGDPATLGTR